MGEEVILIVVATMESLCFSSFSTFLLQLDPLSLIAAFHKTTYSPSFLLSLSLPPPGKIVRHTHLEEGSSSSGVTSVKFSPVRGMIMQGMDGG
jgi:hypothetical protein